MDALGNWDAITTDNITENRTHNSQNQLTAIGSTGLTYDANGNTTADENGNTLVYDAWNRLVEAKQGSTSLIRYEHDGLNRRIEEGNIDVYYTSNWQVIEERNASGAVTTQYIMSPVYIDAMVLRDRDTDANGSLDERLYVMQDANFNVTGLMGTDGLVKQRFVYDPYGLATVLDGSWAATTDSYAWRYLHQGGKIDLVTGLYHFRHREYSPVLGRWMQQDPMGYGDGAQLYGYVNASPVLFVDSFGLATNWTGLNSISGDVRALHKLQQEMGRLGEKFKNDKCLYAKWNLVMAALNWTAARAQEKLLEAIGPIRQMREQLEELGGHLKMYENAGKILKTIDDDIVVVKNLKEVLGNTADVAKMTKQYDRGLQVVEALQVIMNPSTDATDLFGAAAQLGGTGAAWVKLPSGVGSFLGAYTKLATEAASAIKRMINSDGAAAIALDEWKGGAPPSHGKWILGVEWAENVLKGAGEVGQASINRKNADCCGE